MKTKIFTLAIAILGFTTASFAQSTSPIANASATLLTPLSITKDADLNFGNLASTNVGGTVTMGQDGKVTANGVGVKVFDGIPTTAAKFTVTGESGKSYTMNAPGSINLTNGTNPTLTLALDYGTIGATSNALDNNGKSEIFVGGTLTIPANAVAGTYTNTTELKIVVNYQ